MTEYPRCFYCDLKIVPGEKQILKPIRKAIGCRTAWVRCHFMCQPIVRPTVKEVDK
jgi:hypothetical protein